MYSEISPAAQHRISAADFRADYERAMRTASATGLKVSGRARTLAGGAASVPVTVQSRLWGPLKLTLTLPTESVEGARRVAWRGLSLLFPGMAPGTTLSRSITLPRRATLLARDGTVLAESPAGGQAGASRRWEKRRAPSSARSGRFPRRACRRLKPKASRRRRSRHQRSRGGTRRPPARDPRRRAARRRARARLRRPPRRGAGCRTSILPVGPVGGRVGPRQPARRRRGDGPGHRPDPGRRRPRPRRPAAAGLDVQDHHRLRRPAARTSPRRRPSSPTPPTRRLTGSR